MSIADWGVADSGQTWVYAPSFNGAAPSAGFDYWRGGSACWMDFVADGAATQWPAMQLPLPITAPDWVASLKMYMSPWDQGTLPAGSMSQGIGFHDSAGSAAVSAYFQPYSAGSELLLTITTPGGATTTYTAAIASLPDLPYWYWVKVEGTSAGARCRFWLDGASEPGTWAITETPTSAMSYDTLDVCAKVVNATVPTEAGFATLNGTGTITTTTTPVPGQLYPLTQLGTGDGVTVTFTASTAYQSGSLLVFVNGVQTDATEVDTSAGTFSLPFAPQGTTGGLPAEVVEAMWLVGI